MIIVICKLLLRIISTVESNQRVLATFILFRRLLTDPLELVYHKALYHIGQAVLNTDMNSIIPQTITL